jgi:hypothetical protein
VLLLRKVIEISGFSGILMNIIMMSEEEDEELKTNAKLLFN